MKTKLFNEMIDYCLFGQSLSEFVKAHFKELLPYRMGEIEHLWKIAKYQAVRLMSL